MLAIVNCKKKLIDYDGDFRRTFRLRAVAKKTFEAQYSVDENEGTITLTKTDDGHRFVWSSDNVKSVVFFLDGDRVYAEVVVIGEAGGEMVPFSFVVSPQDDLLALGAEKVFEFRNNMDLLTSDGVEVVEVIDPNPLYICPEEAEDIDALRAMRAAEGVDVLYIEEADETFGDDFESNVNAHSFDEPQSQIVENENEEAGNSLDDVLANSSIPIAISATTDADEFDFGEEELVITDDDVAELNDSVGEEFFNASDSADDEFEDDDDFLLDSNIASVVTDFGSDNDEDDEFEDDDLSDTASEVDDVDDIERDSEFSIDGYLESLYNSDAFKNASKAMQEVDDVTDDDGDETDNADDDDSVVAIVDVVIDDEADDDATAGTTADVHDDHQIESHQTDESDSVVDTAEAINAIDTAYEQLSNLHDAIVKRKNEALAEVQKTIDEIEGGHLPGEKPKKKIETPTFTHVTDIKEEIESAEPKMQKPEDRFAAELAALEQKVTVSADEQNEYDEIIDKSNERCAKLLDDYNANELPTAAVVAGLIEMLQEQTEHNEVLNSRVKKEQAMNRYCLMQLEETTDIVTAQKSELDNVKRSLRFSQAAQRKGEKFVADARDGIQGIVAAAKKRVRQAANEMEKARIETGVANEARLAAEEARANAEAERDEALTKRDEAFEQLAAEKNRTENIMEEFDKQLEALTTETVSQVQKQIRRADETEKARTDAEKKISDLENELTDLTSRLLSSETAASKKDIEIEELKKQRDAADGSYGDLMMKYNQQTADMHSAGRALNEAKNELVSARGTIKNLTLENAKVKEERDNAITERVDAIASVKQKAADDLAAAYAERDEAIRKIVGAKDAALAANDELLKAFAAAMTMPEGFGGQKRKLEAFESAYRSFVEANTVAADLGNVSYGDSAKTSVSASNNQFGLDDDEAFIAAEIADFDDTMSYVDDMLDDAIDEATSSDDASQKDVEASDDSVVNDVSESNGAIAPTNQPQVIELDVDMNPNEK